MKIRKSKYRVHSMHEQVQAWIRGYRATRKLCSEHFVLVVLNNSSEKGYVGYRETCWRESPVQGVKSSVFFAPVRYTVDPGVCFHDPVSEQRLSSLSLDLQENPKGAVRIYLIPSYKNSVKLVKTDTGYMVVKK